MKKKLRLAYYIFFLLPYIYEIDLWIPITIIIISELSNQKKNIRKLIRIIRGRNLFQGNDLLFKQTLLEVDLYGEYGVGESTLWVFNNTKAKIMAVDTSKKWISTVKSKIGPSKKITIEWIDLGDLGAWGKPISYKKREFIYNYLESIWLKKEKPQLVLIDGRFRVACFLFSIIAGSPGTKIIFDDYINRPHYHVVEEFIKPTEICGRQALFVIPDNIDEENIQKNITKFLYVMD
tara:strand:+ start:98 stop:802 length:705 start_codon:yes stop_codon:yes gene_type:complete